VFEESVRRLPGASRDEITGGRIKSHDKQLHNLYYSVTVIRVNKKNRIRWWNM
jgi:hypothetical protein